MWPCITNLPLSWQNNFEIHAKMWLQGPMKCTYILENSNNHKFTSRCAVNSNDTSLKSSGHKVLKLAIKSNWSGANFTRGLWYRATYVKNSRGVWFIYHWNSLHIITGLIKYIYFAQCFVCVHYKSLVSDTSTNFLIISLPKFCALTCMCQMQGVLHFFDYFFRKSSSSIKYNLFFLTS